MNKRIKAIIIVLALLISLCIPVMAVDANTSSINTSSVSSYTEETQEESVFASTCTRTPSAEAHLRHYRILFICGALIAVCVIVLVISVIQIVRINHSQTAKKSSKHQPYT